MLTILHCAGQSPTRKDFLVQNVNSVKVEKSCFRRLRQRLDPGLVEMSYPEVDEDEESGRESKTGPLLIETVDQSAYLYSCACCFNFFPKYHQTQEYVIEKCKGS